MPWTQRHWQLAAAVTERVGDQAEQGGEGLLQQVRWCLWPIADNAAACNKLPDSTNLADAIMKPPFGASTGSKVNDPLPQLLNMLARCWSHIFQDIHASLLQAGCAADKLHIHNASTPFPGSWVMPGWP